MKTELQKQIAIIFYEYMKIHLDNFIEYAESAINRDGKTLLT